MENRQNFQRNGKFTSTASIKSKSFDFWRWRAWQVLSVSSFTTTAAFALSANSTNAQITPDTTLGNESSKVTSQETVDTINGGAARGANLFHSFSEFNVNEGRAAYFVNPSGIENIITRVTGANSSNILGTLGVKGGNANLFLLNPNGIVFGANARLDIGGSFIGSTASNLEFADGNKFSTTASQTTPLLTVSVPIGLGFGSNPGNIHVQGNGQGLRVDSNLLDPNVGLEVKPNQTLALVGGNIILEGGTLKTAGGRIELGSVAEPSLVRLLPVGKGWELEYKDISSFGNINLFQQAALDASGSGAGNIKIYGKQIKLTDGSAIENDTLEGGSGGTLVVNASELVEVTGRSKNFEQNASGIFSIVQTGATGSGANINIETKQLKIQDAGQIVAATSGEGAAGSLKVKATNSVEITGTVNNSPTGSGSALTTLVAPLGTGKGGDLNIETKQLIIKDGGVISSAALGKGMAGSLTIKAKDSVELNGKSPDGKFSSRLSARSVGAAEAGNINIKTRKLDVWNGATLNVSSRGRSKAGTFQINADSINLSNGSITAASSSGEGGNIFLQSQNLQLHNGSNITTDATGGSGNGGNININTGTLAALPSENSDITANAIQGRGGNIKISTQGLFGIQFREQPTSSSDNTASSQYGLNGVVDVRVLGFDPRNTLTPFTTAFLPTEKVMELSCLARQNKQRGRFVVTGGGALPATPNSGISEFPLLGEPETAAQPSIQQQPSPTTPDSTLVASSGVWKVGDPIVEAQGLAIAPDGSPVLSVTPSQAKTPNPQETICH